MKLAFYLIYNIQNNVYNSVQDYSIKRNYFGGVKISKLQIQILDKYGRNIDLKNYPTNFVFEFTQEYSSERLDTGVTDIDSAEDQYTLDQLQHQVSLENEVGSIVLENDSATGDVNYMLLETYAIQTQSPYADNLDLDTEAGFDTASTADDILDFTERNPFGELDF